VSATSWGVLVVVVASLTVLAILLVGLVRQLKGLAAALAAVRDRAQPLVERIGRDGALAQERIETIAVEAEAFGSAELSGSRAPGGSGQAPGSPSSGRR
jgi:hypothetical protein